MTINGEKMIPRVIHYCWFGKNPIPKKALKCIKSWQKKCPDYQIVQWNEKNFDINACPRYVQQAYQAKKWAFVTDYARLKIVYDNGGIYLDTDVELKKNLDKLLKYNAYFGKENSTDIATGLGFGAIKHFAIIKELMADYDNIDFCRIDGSFDTTTCITRNKHVFDKYGVSSDDQLQVLTDNILILPTIYLCPIDYRTGYRRNSLKTISIHWYEGSWLDAKMKEEHNIAARKRLIEGRKDYFVHMPNRIGRRLLGNRRYEKIKKKFKKQNN